MTSIFMCFYLESARQKHLFVNNEQTMTCYEAACKEIGLTVNGFTMKGNLMWNTNPDSGQTQELVAGRK